MCGVSRKDREPGEPDQFRAHWEQTLAQHHALRAGWQQEWRRASRGRRGVSYGQWHPDRRAAERDATVFRRLFANTQLESRTVSPPRPVSEEE